MKMTNSLVAEIKSCQYVYSLSDTARHYNKPKETVARLWKGEVYTDVRPAVEPPNMVTKTFPTEWLKEDKLILRRRNMTYAEIAEELNVSHSTVKRTLGGEL
jgi:hypothetical protein